MKLQLLIPQFNETDDVMRPMLESISTQQGVDLKNDIEVLIGNDGSDIKLSEKFLGSFSYSIRYFQFEHAGLPGTRGKLYDLATADYVMFCDADDMFLTNIALYTIFSFTKKGFDALVVDFLEEVVDRKTGTHKKDSTFVHGKIYRRQFLLDNHIVWHPDVKCHEDSGYNSLAMAHSKARLEGICDYRLWTTEELIEAYAFETNRINQKDRETAQRGIKSELRRRFDETLRLLDDEQTTQNWKGTFRYLLNE